VTAAYNDPMTDRYALLGWPQGSGLSGAMHNAAFAAAGIAATYEDRPTPPESLADGVAELRAGHLAGASVTVPHKVAIRRLLDDEDPLVTTLGAVNTVVRTPDGLVGHNTDVGGAHAAIAELLPGRGRGRAAVVLGAGGAARAVVHVLLAEGYAVRVLNRASGRSGTLAAAAWRAHRNGVLATGPYTPAALTAAAADADLLVNATPVGSPPDTTASPWPAGVPLPAHLAVLDLVAWPAETRLVAAARAAGCRAAGGQTMLLHQAAAAFTLWTGQAAPVDVMRGALDAALAGGA
jgi:shikimate dehydrogenase